MRDFADGRLTTLRRARSSFLVGHALRAFPPFNALMVGMSLRRTLLASLGVISTAAGIVGILVPGIPGTVFVIAASHLFASSSPDLETWLRRNRWLGPALQRVVEAGGMTCEGKALALAAMWSELAVGWYVLAGFGSAIRMIMIAFMIIGTAVLLFVVRTVPIVGRQHPAAIPAILRQSLIPNPESLIPMRPVRVQFRLMPRSFHACSIETCPSRASFAASNSHCSIAGTGQLSS
jgi:uncharacterized membrane protein YbaN (DUF454 family)